MLVMHDVGIFRLEDGHTVVEEGILPSLVESDCCAVNYIRGVFLGAGSISAKAGYHLEFGVSNPEFAADSRKNNSARKKNNSILKGQRNGVRLSGSYRCQ